MLISKRARLNILFPSLMLLLLVLSCDKTSQDTNVEITHDYLIGSWERTNDQEGRNTYEIWTKDGKEYKGLGYTMSAGDTIFKEQLRLFKQETTWILEVSGVNESPTPFILTDFTTHSFVAQNPQNEFPKTIRYNYFDDTITAIISDEETEIPFIFWRVVD